MLNNLFKNTSYYNNYKNIKFFIMNIHITLKYDNILILKLLHIKSSQNKCGMKTYELKF